MIAGLDLVSLIGWVIIFGAGVAWEFKGIFDQRAGDTLSEMVWRLVKTWAGWRWLIAGFLGWLIVHFVFLGQFG